jgi:hypothetical protein
MTSSLRVFTCVRARTAASALVIGGMASMPAFAFAQAPVPGRPTAIQSLDAAPLPGGDASALTIHANGPLPVPTVGVLDGPPRIYLDFAGVRLPSGIRAEWQDPRTRGVRLAQHTIDPLVARIVIDLVNPIAHRVDASERTRGKVVVLLGEEVATATGTPRPAGRSREADAYVLRISRILLRLQALRPIVGGLDSGAGAPDVDLEAAAAELESLGRTLSAMRVVESLATTHDLLMRSCALGSRAIMMRRDASVSGDAAAVRNAGSAAAGALILLDRATRDLGYIPP